MDLGTLLFFALLVWAIYPKETKEKSNQHRTYEVPAPKGPEPKHWKNNSKN